MFRSHATLVAAGRPETGSTSVTSHGIVWGVPKIRRGGFVFLALFLVWKGDHFPRHVHVHRDGCLVVKWDLENWLPMKDKAGARILRLVEQLQKEGVL